MADKRGVTVWCCGRGDAGQLGVGLSHPPWSSVPLRALPPRSRSLSRSECVNGVYRDVYAEIEERYIQLSCGTEQVRWGCVQGSSHRLHVFLCKSVFVRVCV